MYFTVHWPNQEWHLDVVLQIVLVEFTTETQHVSNPLNMEHVWWCKFTHGNCVGIIPGWIRVLFSDLLNEKIKKNIYEKYKLCKKCEMCQTIIFKWSVESWEFWVVPRSCTKKLYHRRRKLVHLGMSGGKIFKREKRLFF